MTKTSRRPSTNPIFITDYDRSRLQEMIGEIQRQKNQCQRDDLEALVSELERATVVESTMIPKNVITMNSRVSMIDLDTSERFTFTLVFPDKTDPAKKTISVLAPVGAGMLGFRTGDEFEWKVPAGKRRLKITRVSYQPEANQHYHL